MTSAMEGRGSASFGGRGAEDPTGAGWRPIGPKDWHPVFFGGWPLEEVPGWDEWSRPRRSICKVDEITLKCPRRWPEIIVFWSSVDQKES